MDVIQTPVRNRQVLAQKPVTIPPSPFLKKLGYGTGVAVYKLNRSPIANQVRSPWALKKLIKRNIINTEYGKRLEKEANILRKLNHPNIVGFRGFLKTSDNEGCLAMEECDISLGDMIEERKEVGMSAFPAKNVMKVALDIAEALNYLHTQILLLHCDVKSYNVLVKGDFNVCKLCDFGVTLPLKSDGEIDRARAGKHADYIGTRPWCAPEVLKEPQIITSKADVYSYGLVLWEMLALVPPCMEDFEENVSPANESANLDESVTSVNDSVIVIEDSFDEGNEDNSGGFGKRPKLPPVEFDESYKYVLEIFHCCTDEDPAARPSALDLTISIPEMIKELGFI